jgi:hypothetical protein
LRVAAWSLARIVQEPDYDTALGFGLRCYVDPKQIISVYFHLRIGAKLIADFCPLNDYRDRFNTKAPRRFSTSGTSFSPRIGENGRNLDANLRDRTFDFG